MQTHTLRRLLGFGLVTSLLGACVELPTGPTVAVMPGPYKPFEVFTSEEQTCRGYAQQQIGVSPGDAEAGSTAAGAVAGAALGAATGALIGRSGGAAGVGAGIGLLAGSSIGNDNGARSARYLQYRYNVAYEQCMYAKGNQVPGYVSANAAPRYSTPPPPPPR
jgi:hypothetical protein